MVYLVSGPEQGHGRCGYISTNDDHEYRVRCSTVSKRLLLSLALMLGFSISSQRKRVSVKLGLCGRLVTRQT